MALHKKYADLPGLVCLTQSRCTRVRSKQLTIYLNVQDSAPDIYETPDLTDGDSTVPVSIPGMAVDVCSCVLADAAGSPQQCGRHPIKDSKMNTYAKMRQSLVAPSKSMRRGRSLCRPTLTRAM